MDVNLEPDYQWTSTTITHIAYFALGVQQLHTFTTPYGAYRVVVSFLVVAHGVD